MDALGEDLLARTRLATDQNGAVVGGIGLGLGLDLKNGGAGTHDVAEMLLGGEALVDDGLPHLQLQIADLGHLLDGDDATPLETA